MVIEKRKKSAAANFVGAGVSLNMENRKQGAG